MDVESEEGGDDDKKATPADVTVKIPSHEAVSHEPGLAHVDLVICCCFDTCLHTYFTHTGSTDSMIAKFWLPLQIPGKGQSVKWLGRAIRWNRVLPAMLQPASGLYTSDTTIWPT